MTQIGTDIIDRIRAREVLLGDRFKPREKDIPTPQLLLDAGFPQDSLRLVGLPADKALGIKEAALQEKTGVLYSALCVCACLRWRADNEPIFAPADVQALIGQDVSLLNDLAAVVHEFLGVRAKAVTDAKNDSGVQTEGADGPKSDGGGESPSASDSLPPESVSEPSSTATS